MVGSSKVRHEKDHLSCVCGSAGGDRGGLADEGAVLSELRNADEQGPVAAFL